MDARHQQEEAIFDAAIKLPAGERAAYLDHVCGEGSELRQRLESLLRACQSSCNFLDSPPDCVMTGSGVGMPSFEKVGDRIGRYKLLQQIGEGGCGVVYLAEQEEPVRRRVALKIIKLGMDTKSVIARFEAERQALALMDHPNIAKVLDAGATETGRPYFVMELVRGLRITEYCDEQKLSTRQRLELFIQVCQAIQHAHQKGIIHRDIKPSNILVTLDDADNSGLPKVIDFGIAKATNGLQLTDKTLFTAFEQFMGTPAYMSPEQAVITNVDIDTRSDIYALGVLLYELLTGKTPFDAKELLAVGLDEMRRTICQREPPRPSTRLSTLPGRELSTAAQRRGLDAPKLLNDLRGDLDWIVMKALEKDRARRYETANGLAADIERHLNNEPVLARPPSVLYRFGKTVSRNKLAFTVTAMVSAALVSGFGISTWLFLKERQARGRAVSAERAERKLRQEAELRELNTLALQLAVQLSEPEPPEPTVTKALEAVQRPVISDDPNIASEYEQLARVLRIKRHFVPAEKASRTALAIYRNNSPEGDLRVAESLQRLAFILANQEKWTEQEELCREAVRIRQRLQGNSHADTALAVGELAASLCDQRKTAEALPLFSEAFSSCNKLLPNGDPRLSILGENLTRILIDLHRFSEAAEVARDFVPFFVAGRRFLDFQNNPANAKGLEQLSRLARPLFTQGRYQVTEQILNDLAVKMPDSSTILRARGEYYAQYGRWNQAAADFSRVIQLQAEDKNRMLRYDSDHHKLASLLIQSGDLPGYREHCQQSLARFGHTRETMPAHQLSKACLTLPDSGVDLTTVGRLADLSVTVEDKWGPFSSNEALAEYRLGRFASAVDWAERTLEHVTHPEWLTIETSLILAMAHYQLNQSELAHAALRRVQDDARKTLPKLDSADLGQDWIDVIICDRLLREANALIEGSANGMRLVK